MANQNNYILSTIGPSDTTNNPSHRAQHNETKRAIEDFASDPALQPPGGTVDFYRADGTWAAPPGSTISPSDYGAVADVQSYTGGTWEIYDTAPGVSVVAPTTGVFTQGEDEGKYFYLPLNPLSGSDKGVYGTIATVTANGQTVTLTGTGGPLEGNGGNPDTMVGSTAYWGTDNATAFQSLEAAVSAGDTIYLGAGSYMTSDLPPLLSGQRWIGEGPSSTKIYYIGTNHAIEGTDLTDIELSNFSLFGRGRLGSTTDGIRIDKSVNDANYYLTFRNLYVEGFGQDGISLNTPIVSNFDRVVSFRNAKYGMYLYGSGQLAGTSCVLNNCFTGGNYAAGYKFNIMAYTTLNSCAADANGVGYIYTTCNGITENSCGTEETYDFQSLGFTAEVPNGLSRYIFNTKIVLNSPAVYGNIGTAFEIDNNAKVIMNTPFEGSPWDGTPAPEDYGGPGNTYSVDVLSDTCDVIVSNPSFATPINPNGRVKSVDSSFNVSDYDGIQAAIDAAEAAGGGVVNIPPGTYTETLTVNSSNVIIQGSGPSTILQGVGAAPIITMTDVSYCGVRDLSLRGQWANSRSGIKAQGVTLSRFDNLIGREFQAGAYMIDLRATGSNGCSRNTFTHIHTDGNTIGFIYMSNDANGPNFVTLNTFSSISAIISNTASSPSYPAIDFHQGADNNHFTGVTRLDLNSGANIVYGVSYNKSDINGGNEVYENHFDDLMIDNDGASNVPLRINECTNNGGFSEIHYRPGGSQGEGAGNSIAADAYANVNEGNVGGDGSINKTVGLTQTQYDALTPDPNTLYVITGP